MSDALWLILIVGGFGGFFVGRWWTERTRALHDMRRVWAHRRSYRS